MPALYELVASYRHTLEALENTDGLTDEQIAEQLYPVQGSLHEKATNVAMYARNLESDAEAIREAGLAMLARAVRVDERAERLREYIKGCMKNAGVTKIACPQFTMGVKLNPPKLVIDDRSVVPDRFWVAAPPPPPQLDTKAIKDELQAGKEVDGCRLTQEDRLDIRI